MSATEVSRSPIPATARSAPSIRPADLSRLLNQTPSAELIDVRTQAEFAAAHVPGAKLLPLDQLDPASFLESRAGAPDLPVYVICQTGGRAAKAISKLRRAGYHGCVLVEGGTQGWIDAGLPVELGRSTVLPLIRQVQLAVGIVSFVGSILALTANPLFALIPALTGAGLTFTGATGHCGLAILLARMPWNRATALDSACNPS